MAITFLFLILPNVHILDLAGPDQAIHEAIEFGAPFNIKYCQLKGKVSTSAGLPLSSLSNYKKQKLKKGDFLIIPGAASSYITSDAFKKNNDLFTWILGLNKEGVNICSICAGAFVLAQTGLLNGIDSTTHFKKTKELQTMFPQTNVIDNILYTDCNGIYTSAGIASGIDLILHIIEKLKGSFFAHLVARELVVYKRRNGNNAQESEIMKFRNHIHIGIHNVQDWIIENIHKRPSLTQLASIANMSERNFTRVFRKETGLSVITYINIIRKEKIQDLLKNKDFSRLEIAKLVGLQSERQLSRIINNIVKL
jgi:transcriptional regulator GlxA family with amidase domain